MAKSKKRQPTRALAKPKKNAPKASSKASLEAAQSALFKLPSIGVWLVILLPPFVLLPGFADTFRLPKLLASELLALLSLILLSLRLWRQPRILVGWLRRPVVVAVLPLVFVVSLGWWTSAHPHRVQQALPSLWIAAACWICWTLAMSFRQRRQILLWLTFPALVLALIGIAQFFGLSMGMTASLSSLSDRMKMISLAGGVFDLSAFLLLPLLIAQVSWLADERPRQRRLWAAAALIFMFAILASQTLSVIAASLLSTLCLWAGKFERRRFATWALGLSVGLVVLSLALSPVRERLLHKWEGWQRVGVNHLLTGRLDAWRASIWMFEQHPLTGVGHGAYRRQFGHAKLALQQQGVEFFRGHKQAFFENAHNDLLQAAAEWGLCGLLALGWLVWCLVRQMRMKQMRHARARAPDGEDGADRADKTDSRPPEGKPNPDPADLAWRRLYLPALVAMGTLSLVNFPFHLAMVAYPWLLLLADIFAQGAGTEA